MDNSKKLYCCETARDSFVKILDIVGGPNEQMRGLKFLERITVIPDDATAKDTINNEGNLDVFTNVQRLGEKLLKVGGKTKKKSLKIFMFGNRIQAVTVTSNDAFVRATKQKGVHFVVFLHESRALTEQREIQETQKK